MFYSQEILKKILRKMIFLCLVLLYKIRMKIKY